MRTDLRSRFQGAIVGLAGGDTLRYSTEFLHSPDAIHEKQGPEDVTDPEPDWPPAGTYTDDTQMTLAIAGRSFAPGISLWTS